jgi:uncharacterized RDD family membrane protein YckC
LEKKSAVEMLLARAPDLSENASSPGEFPPHSLGGVPGFKVRSTAWMIDLLLYLFVTYVALSVAAKIGHFNLSRYPQDIFLTISVPLLLICVGYIALIFFLVRVLPTVLWGTSLGKKICGLEVLDVRTGQTPGYAAAFGRSLLILIGDLFGSVVIATAFYHPQRRHVADLLFHTQVIDTRSERPRLNRQSVLATVYIGLFCLPLIYALPSMLVQQLSYFRWDHHAARVIYYVDLPEVVAKMGIPQIGGQLPSAADLDTSASDSAHAAGGHTPAIVLKPYADETLAETYRDDDQHCLMVQTALGARAKVPVENLAELHDYCRCVAVNMNTQTLEFDDGLDGLVARPFDEKFKSLEKINTACRSAVTSAAPSEKIN